jgi:NADH-quinone oxidoreductase subunit G
MATVTKGAAPGTGATIGYCNRPGRGLEGVPESELFTITLDGREVKARKGDTIMEVCHREDTYVPHYCWHPSLSIAGNCRLCLVEVEKVPKPVIGCQTQVTPGMVVRTKSDQTRSAQKWMMEFLLVNHPLDCPICDRGGECQLQRYSMEYGTGHTRMADKKRKFIKPQADPLIDIERNRCIMCTRCVRFCDEVGGEHVMGVFDRGDGNYIGTFGQGPVSNIFSGNVIDLCPVGCLTNKPHRFRARPWELQQTQSTCDLCSAGCKVTHWTRNERHYRTTPPSRLNFDHFTINEDTEEFICNQGRFGSDYTQHESRLDQSHVRRVGRLMPTSFEDAVAAAADRLRETVKAHGPASVALLVSPRATLEEGLLARDLAREVIGTPHVDWRSAFRTPAIAQAVSLALDAADGDLEHDPDVIVVLSGRLAHQAPVLALRLQELARRYQKTIVQIGHYHDPYLAAHAAHRFHVAPGRTAEALAALASALASGDATALAASLGSAQADAASLLAVLKAAERGLLVHALEDLGGLYAPAEVPTAARLTRALGDNWGYLPVVRDRNAVGLHRLAVEPGVDGLAAPALPAAIADGSIKALAVFGADALAALPAQEALQASLASLDTLIVADHFDNPYNRHASVFLALAGNLERDGSYADIEGNLALLKAAHPCAGGSRSGIDVLTALGRALGAPSFGADNPAQAFRLVRGELAPESICELADLELEGSTNSAHYVNIRPRGGARTRSAEDNPGNYRTDGLHLRGKRAVALPEVPARCEAPAGDLLLTWGPHVSGRGYVTDRAGQADILLPKPFLEVARADAARLGLRDGQFAVLTVSGQRAKVAIRLSGAPAPGTAYMSAGVYGPFDPARCAGPEAIGLEGLDEQVPDQGATLTTAQ